MKRTIIHSVIANIFIKAIYASTAFLTTVLLARELGADEFGIYTIAFAIVSVLAIPIQFGTPILLTREIAHADSSQDWGLMKGIIVFTHSFVIVFSIIIIAIALIILTIFEEHIGTHRANVIMVSLFLIPLLSLGALRDAILRGLRKVTLGLLTEQVFRPIFFLLSVIIVLVTCKQSIATAYNMIVLHTIAAALAFVGGLTIYLRTRPPALRAHYPQYDSKRWIKAILPLGMIGALHLINNYADIILISLFKDSSDVAYYKIAIQLAFLVELILIVFNSVLAPYFSRLHVKGEKQELQALVSFSAKIIVSLTIPVFLVIVLFGDRIIVLTVGRDYLNAYIPLVILSLGQVVNAIVGSAGLLLKMTGHEKEVALSMAKSAVFNIVFNLILIPPFGLIGAASATAMSMLIWNFFLWRASYTRLRIHTVPFLKYSYQGLDREAADHQRNSLT